MEDNKKQVEIMEEIYNINSNKNLNYFILTMGCKLNENDSEKLSGMLEKMGYKETNNMDESDLIIFNTCCVRENAEDKLFGKLGEVKKLKEKKEVILAIGGCMMQEEHITTKINQSYPFYDIIFGTHTLHKFPEDLYEVIKQKNKLNDILYIDGEIHEGLPIKRQSKITASVTIMNGCNNFCTYCIVPYVRGRERSRKPIDIINEIKDLAKNGYKEIILLGQNVNSYNGGENYGFAELLSDIDKIEGLEIIKFISPHPKDFNDKVIKTIKNSNKISKMIHLPLQSGSNNILKTMNRKYTKEKYLELVSKIKAQIPNVAFSTDIIVGFPGETKEDFEDTLDVISKVNYEQVYMFIYSRRKGTPADNMKNQIEEEIKHERFEKLKELSESKIESSNKKYINTIQKVLVEGRSKTNKQMLTGRTTTNKVVIFKGTDDLINNIINIKILSEHKWFLKGIYIKEE